MGDDPEPMWGEWGAPVRVRIDHAPVWAFARAVRDDNPVYASEVAARAADFDAVPAPPTFTFVMRHTGAYPDIQLPPSGHVVLESELSPDGVARTGLYLHGEQHFEYHRQPVVGDLLEGRVRVSRPVAKRGSRGAMELTYIETRWCDLDGALVVTERIVSVFLSGEA